MWKRLCVKARFSMKKNVEEWVERGEHDLEAAQLLAEETRQVLDVASELIEKIRIDLMSH